MSDFLLGPAGFRAMELRKIGPETVERFGLYTAAKGEISPQTLPTITGNVLAFPFRDRTGTVVNVKYRQLPLSTHQMWQSPGGQQIFWNEEILFDPALETALGELIITEGEIDALTAIDVGFEFTVSIPAGAVGVPGGLADPTADLPPLDPATEAAGKFAFMHRVRDRLAKINGFIIAMDRDPQGQRMAAELVRRLNPRRCRFVTYPDKPVIEEESGLRPCKDLNEVLREFGSKEVVRILQEAKPYPITGLYRLEDFPDLPEIATVRTPWPTLDACWKPFLEELVILLGIPGHGKSLFAANMLVHFAETQGWKAAIFSQEEPVVPFLRAKLRRMAAPKTDAWLNENFRFICPDPTRQTDELVYLDWLLERATDAVLRDGIKVLLIDPWNEIEQARVKGENQTEYIARCLREINRWRHQHNVMVILAVHPTKEVGKDGKSRWPTPYDADGSAAWYNKADHFLVIHRENLADDLVKLRVAKCKFEGTGRTGDTTLRYNAESCRYETLQPINQEEMGV